ncbi:MAG: rhodanese-like domain-containing protein [Terrimicrobiaceae bacterium]
MSTYKSISVKETVERMKSGGVMVDVRTAGEYEGSHVAGSVLHPLQELNPAKVKELSQGAPVYVMCQAGMRAARAAGQLAASGIDPVFVVDGGMNAWEAAGLPVQRGGRRVLPIERQARLCMGALAFVGGVLAYLVNPAWAGLSVFAGAGLIFSALTDWCGLGLMLARMPWNASNGGGGCCGSRTCGEN